MRLNNQTREVCPQCGNDCTVVEMASYGVCGTCDQDNWADDMEQRALQAAWEAEHGCHAGWDKISA